VSLRRLTLIVGVLFYIFLWVLAANGASSLVAVLVVPAVLAVMVALGVALNRFMGIAPHRPHFNDRDDEKGQ
jgi:multidrug efflux pump subunit AcrB